MKNHHVLPHNIMCARPTSNAIVKNKCLSPTTGNFFFSQKSAIITPLLKKASLDPEALTNYRPVSNITFVSKLLERILAKQLHDHLSQHQLYKKHQSAYRKRHSTETALTRVQNHVLRAMDDSEATVLVLLDVSAAFDTVDHNLLLERLKQCDSSGTAQSWLKSYLEGKSQKVALMKADQLRHHLDSVFHKGLCWVQFYSRSILSLWVRYVVGMVSNTISMLMTLNCMYPLSLVMQWISWRLNFESKCP